VLDFFGGGGTTAKVCAGLNRRFITGDVSPVAVRVIADRLLSGGKIKYKGVSKKVTKSPLPKKPVEASDSEIQEVSKQSYEKKKKLDSKRKIRESVNNTKFFTPSRNKSAL